MEITFPNYFNKNPNFQSLCIEGEVFVDYVHQLDSIKDVQLSIERTFFLFVIKGEVKLVGPDGDVCVGEGESVIVKRGGYIMSESLSDVEGEFQAFLFFLSESLIQEFCVNKGLVVNNTGKELEAVHSIENNALLTMYVNSIRLLMDKNKNYHQDSNFVRMKAMELLYHLCESQDAERIESILTDRWDSEEVLIRQIMNQNFNSKLTLDKLAFLCGMSVSNFKRKFEAIYQNSPGKWIKEKKLTLAYNLLKQSNKSVSEICDEIGFQSVSYFIQTFKSKFGVSPARLKGSMSGD